MSRLSKAEVERLRRTLPAEAFTPDVDELPELVPPTEARHIAGVANNTLWRWRRTGRIESVRHSGSGWHFYRRADLEALVAERGARKQLKPLPTPVTEPAIRNVAAALAVTRSAARQLLSGEMPWNKRIGDEAMTEADRWRYEHRRGMRP